MKTRAYFVSFHDGKSFRNLIIPIDSEETMVANAIHRYLFHKISSECVLINFWKNE